MPIPTNDFDMEKQLIVKNDKCTADNLLCILNEIFDFDLPTVCAISFNDTDGFQALAACCVLQQNARKYGAIFEVAKSQISPCCKR